MRKLQSQLSTETELVRRLDGQLSNEGELVRRLEAQMEGEHERIAKLQVGPSAARFSKLALLDCSAVRTLFR